MAGNVVSNGSNEAHERLVKGCLTELALWGFVAWENPRRAVQVNGRWVSLTKAGRGDIHVIFPFKLADKLYGIHGEVECKTGDAKQSTKQRAHMRAVRKAGGIYLLVRDHVDDMRTQLKARGFIRRDFASAAEP